MRATMVWIRPILLAVAAVSLTACATQRPRPSAMAAVAPQLSVEAFLQASNQRDFESMGRIFGTSSGPVMDTGSTFGCMFKKMGSWFGGSSCERKRDVELRLDAIANVLQHRDYVITREERVAGRENPTTRVFVDLSLQGRRVSDIPFTVVQASNGRWLVESIDLNRVMTGGSGG